MMAIIGREPPADIVIPAPQVSARHAEIRPLSSDLYLLTDLGSTNGTFVNGRRIQRETIRLTDDVRLGSHPVPLAIYQTAIVAGAPPQPIPAGFAPLAFGGDTAPIRLALAPAPPLHAPDGDHRQGPVALPQPPAAAKPERSLHGEVLPPEARASSVRDEMAAAIASQATFSGKAIGTFLLYWFGLWLVGAIMNMIYLAEANRVKRLAGRSPSGRGCLIFLLVTHFLPGILLIVALVVTGGAILHSLSRFW